VTVLQCQLSFLNVISLFTTLDFWQLRTQLTERCCSTILELPRKELRQATVVTNTLNHSQQERFTPRKIGGVLLMTGGVDDYGSSALHDMFSLESLGEHAGDPVWGQHIPLRNPLAYFLYPISRKREIDCHGNSSLLCIGHNYVCKQRSHHSSDAFIGHSQISVGQAPRGGSAIMVFFRNWARTQAKWFNLQKCHLRWKVVDKGSSARTMEFSVKGHVVSYRRQFGVKMPPPSEMHGTCLSLTEQTKMAIWGFYIDIACMKTLQY